MSAYESIRTESASYYHGVLSKIDHEHLIKVVTSKVWKTEDMTVRALIELLILSETSVNLTIENKEIIKIWNKLVESCEHRIIEYQDISECTHRKAVDLYNTLSIEKKDQIQEELNTELCLSVSRLPRHKEEVILPNNSTILTSKPTYFFENLFETWL